MENIISALHEITASYPEQIYQEKILYFIKNDLSNKLKTIKNKKQLQTMENNNIKNYINEFLINGKPYFYIEDSETYLKYDNTSFKIENESNIENYILKDLVKNKKLNYKKYIIKDTIMRKIRDTHLFSVIPNSNTIQNVLNFFTANIFKTRDMSKYLLTVIGDNILKKNTNLKHLVDDKFKYLIILIEEGLRNFFKRHYHANTTFKYSWNEYDYKYSRIVNTDYGLNNKEAMRIYIKNNILNLIAVSVYYSNKFNNSEDFLKKIKFKKTILFLKHETPKTITDIFLKDMGVKDSSDKTNTISAQDMVFLWKSFLIEKNYPNIMYFNTLINCLKDKYTFKDNKFYGIISHTNNKLKNINIFWKKCMKYDKTCETEISEITEIFNDWVENKTNSVDYYIDERILTEYLLHAHNIHIYGKNTICYSYLIWDKKKEINEIFNIIKNRNNKELPEFETSIDKCYTDYCKECSRECHTNYNIVSKAWFEKYIYQIIPEKYIVKKRILNDFWRC